MEDDVTLFEDSNLEQTKKIQQRTTRVNQEGETSPSNRLKESDLNTA